MYFLKRAASSWAGLPIAHSKVALHIGWDTFRGGYHSSPQSVSSRSVTHGSQGTQENALTDLSKYGNVLGGEIFVPEALDTFITWHQCVSMAMQHGPTIDNAAKVTMEQKLRSRVDDKCKFYPPTYFSHWTGGDEFVLLISAVSEVFGSSFRYDRQWLSPDGLDWALEFSAEIGDSKKRIDGIDLVKLDENGRIIEFRVLARPPNGVVELKNAMMAKVAPRLAKLKAQQALGSLFK